MKQLCLILLCNLPYDVTVEIRGNFWDQRGVIGLEKQLEWSMWFKQEQKVVKVKDEKTTQQGSSFIGTSHHSSQISSFDKLL